MTTITDAATLAAIKTAYDNSDWQNAYKLIYEAITHGGDSTEDTRIPNDGVDEAVAIWINGAIHVNANDSFFGTYIRNYTKEQYKLRSGLVLTDQQTQRVSNDIAKSFVADVLDHHGTIPTLQAIAKYDAGAAASDIFEGAASSTGAKNYSPWAGTVLFTNLGDGEYFSDWIANSGTSTFKVESGTYDLGSGPIKFVASSLLS
jgi:hypothetical protein